MSTSTLPPRERRHRALSAGVLIVAILAAYGGTLRAPFVYDDILSIAENPGLEHFWPTSSADGGLTTSGRPVLHASLALNRMISGADPWSYHVFNIMVHGAAALVALGLIRRTLLLRDSTGTSLADHARSTLAASIAGCWALHPLLTQSVTYIAQRAESLMGLCLLTTVYAFGRAHSAQASTPRSRRLWLGLCLTAALVGVGTKEVMVVAPLLVLLYDRTFLSGSLALAWQRHRAQHLALAATWLVLAGLIASTGGNRGGTVGLGVGVTWWSYPLTQFKALATYLARTVWPHPLTFEYGTFWTRGAAEVLPYAMLVLPLLAGTVWALRHRPALGFCGAWFFLILAPTSLAPGTIQMIVEHRMYLPLLGLVTPAIVLLHSGLGRRLFRPLIAGCAALGLTTFKRNHDYRDAITLWHDTVAKRPENPRAHDGLAGALEAAGQAEVALAHRREAVRLQPDDSTYHYNLALTLATAGRPDAAIPSYQRSLSLFPNEPRAHNNLAILLGRTGDQAGALDHYAATVRLRPDDASYHFNYGVALVRAARMDEAIARYRDALRLRPDHTDAHFNLGGALLRQNQLPAAFEHYAAAIQLRPDAVDYRTTFGGALLLARRPADALEQFQRALELDSASVDARLGAGNALTTLRRPTEAIPFYQGVLQQSPDHATAHFKLGNALLDLDRVPEATRHYEAAARLVPGDAETQHNLGIAYARQERWSEARLAFENALRLKPDYADAQRNLAQLRAVLGR